jgi:hypothetical protein
MPTHQHHFPFLKRHAPQTSSRILLEPCPAHCTKLAAALQSPHFSSNPTNHSSHPVSAPTTTRVLSPLHSPHIGRGATMSRAIEKPPSEVTHISDGDEGSRKPKQPRLERGHSAAPALASPPHPEPTHPTRYATFFKKRSPVQEVSLVLQISTLRHA